MTPTDRAQPLSVPIGQAGAATLEQARRLVWFARECIRTTPLGGARTPLALLRGRGPLLHVLEEIERWLDGEPVAELLRSMHDVAFEAALGTGRFERDMTGPRAACWSVFEVYQAVLAAEDGEFPTAARKAAVAAMLAGRCGDGGPTPAALAHQERLLREALAP